MPHFAEYKRGAITFRPDGACDAAGNQTQVQFFAVVEEYNREVAACE